MNREEICIIGHVCRDLMEEEYAPGSGVIFGGKCLIALKQTINVFTKVYILFVSTNIY
jgi:hypothetical protein